MGKVIFCIIFTFLFVSNIVLRNRIEMLETANKELEYINSMSYLALIDIENKLHRLSKKINIKQIKFIQYNNRVYHLDNTPVYSFKEMSCKIK